MFFFRRHQHGAAPYYFSFMFPKMAAHPMTISKLLKMDRGKKPDDKKQVPEKKDEKVVEKKEDKKKEQGGSSAG
ncbi:hypothetical protein J6590_073579 [Homalodisca vitripennis]|nr:hypothetical protein J6590_073579 [Homalodisca vitripennis]